MTVTQKNKQKKHNIKAVFVPSVYPPPLYATMSTPVQLQWFFKKDEMKANAGSKHIFIARDWKTAQGRMVKQFAAIDSHETLLHYIQQLRQEQQQASVYELIRYNSPCRLYFDVEWTAADTDDSDHVISVITNFVDTLLQATSETARKKPHLRRCEVLQSSRAGNENCRQIKHSFHLVYPGITVANNTVAMQRITAKVHAHCEKLFPKNPIDMSVYTRDRLFRAPLCWKATDNTHTPLLLTHGDQQCTQRLLDCFVTNIASPGIWFGGSAPEPSKPTATTAHKQTRGQPRPSSTPSDVFLTGSKVNLCKLEKKLQCIIREHGGLGRVQFYRTVESAAILLFRLEHGMRGREEKCLAHGLNSNVTHKNDNQLISVDTNGLVRIICPHKGKCYKARYMLCKLETSYFMSRS